MKKGLSIAIPACREEKNLKRLIPRIQKAAGMLRTPYEIIIVDSAKPQDHTADVCARYGCRYVNQRYPGFGGAYRTAIEEASFDHFLIMDGDGSHNPEYIPKMAAAFKKTGCDVVIGSRYVKGGVTKDAPLSVFLSRILNLVFRAATGLGAHDLSTNFRLCRTALLKKIRPEAEHFDINQEVLVLMRAANGGKLSIREIPIVFEKRACGRSKRKWIPFIISYLRSLYRLTLLSRCPALSPGRYQP